MAEQTTLKRGRIGTTALVFMIIAASAPLTVLAGGAPTNFAVSGLLGLPISYLFLGAVLILFAVGYCAMSSRVHNAGAFYAYISQGLGPRHGIAAALLALVSYNMLQIGLYGLFGFSLSAAIATWTGMVLPWWMVGAVGWIFVAVVGISNVDLSAKVLGVLVVLEFLVVIVIMGIALFNAPEGVSSVTLRSTDFFVPGIGVLLAFSIAAFMGFESGGVTLFSWTPKLAGPSCPAEGCSHGTTTPIYRGVPPRRCEPGPRYRTNDPGCRPTARPR